MHCFPRDFHNLTPCTRFHFAIEKYSKFRPKIQSKLLSFVDIFGYINSEDYSQAFEPAYNLQAPIISEAYRYE